MNGELKKYSVTLIYDASENVEVEAESVDEAIQKAHENSKASLCHHCSRNLDLGDVYREDVYDENGDEVSRDEE